ncbi:hypothetical protein M378DRAFT_158687 [Amanita muscaria Koide BX008]|uniref:C3H1-type domain-containing protein n=1 Tax=Amanita muscaria (strain Koide BX008) TaxID=946122 RepID=A0A0C2TLZ1_AMAMK|nr:hypothetical protein M378DRAFT_158687 [Amanita muscaria Koide BX008]
MATQPRVEASQQLWDEMLARLINLSTVTVRHNAELQNRVAELEMELSVWKQAHSVALEVSEREAKAHNVQIAALNRQISNLDCFRGTTNPLILCVVNGDEKIFLKDLVSQGQIGGKTAAQQLTKAIAEYLSKEELHIFGRLSFWITIFVNKSEIFTKLLGHDFCTAEQLEDFFAGFSAASPRFIIVDTGFGDEAVSLKIKEYLQTFTRFPQTLRVFFAAYDLSRYIPLLEELEKEQALGKIIRLFTPGDRETEKSSFSLPRLPLDDVFITQQVLCMLQSGSPQAVPFNGGADHQSPVNMRPVDSTLPLHKQNPPPCNEFYLMTCSKGPGACKYSHDYKLTPEQLELLAINAKKAPCNWLKNGVPCPHGGKCCWGHVCPNGPKCFHLSKGKCWFKGEAMHPPLSDTAQGMSYDVHQLLGTERL